MLKGSVLQTSQVILVPVVIGITELLQLILLQGRSNFLSSEDQAKNLHYHFVCLSKFSKAVFKF